MGKYARNVLHTDWLYGPVPWLVAILAASGVVLAMGVAPQRPALPEAPDFAGIEPVAVRSVIDADTIRVATSDGGSEVIRLVGVDAPESIAPHGRESTIWAHNLLDGEAVWVVTKEDETLDAYNRRLGYVYRAPDALFVNLEAVRQGYGKCYRRFPFQFKAEFIAWEEYARAHHKGLWRGR